MDFKTTYKNLFSLDGKVAVIAGGTGGIGSAIAEGLGAFGAKIVIACPAPSWSGAEALIKRLSESEVTAWFYPLDILDTPALVPAFEKMAGEIGVPDILVNSVGTHREAPALDYTEEDWDRVLDLNLKGAFFLSQAVAKLQIARGGGGKHVHITSVRSVLALRGRGYISYCSSKGGMALMVRQLAMEWADKHVNVNAIGPTFTRTNLVKTYLEDPNFYNPLVARIPLGRICEPQDVAALAIFLCSPAADFLTGQNILLDGGISASQ